MKYSVYARLFSAVSAVFALSLCSPSLAQTADAEPKAQLAGIEYRVIDRVWINADHYFHEGDYNRIVALCRICVESDPDFDEAYSSAAWILWSMDDKPAANDFLDYGTKRAKVKWKAQYTFAENLMVRKEYKEALPHLQEATKSPTASPMAWKQLAHAYERTGNLPKSLETWKYIVKRFPDEIAAPVNRDRVAKKISGTTKAGK